MAADPSYPRFSQFHVPLASGQPTPMRPRSTSELRAEDVCPACQKGRLDYDGLLNLACAACGYSLSGCFT